MKEKAFIVDKNSEMYKNYFLTENERAKAKELANTFLKKHNLSGNRFLVNKRFCVDLNKEEQIIHQSELMSKKHTTGLFQFKKTSQTQKEWDLQVASKIDFKLISKTNMWWFGHIQCGEFSLWAYEDVLYGYLSDRYSEDFTLPENCQEIKMSEYYQTIEKAEQEDK